LPTPLVKKICFGTMSLPNSFASRVVAVLPENANLT
jgi:hypothetical protein